MAVHLAHKKPIPVIPKGYIPKQVEEEKPERNQLT